MAVAVTVGHAQKDGRKYVVERHSDAIGDFCVLEYLAAVGADAIAIANARASAVLEKAAKDESADAVELDIMPALRFQTAQDHFTRVREYYREAKSARCSIVARYFVHRLDAGDVTQAQLRNLFGKTVAEWPNFENKLRAQAKSADDVEKAEGE